MARAWIEHARSKEILQSRCFDSAGELNPLSAQLKAMQTSQRFMLNMMARPTEQDEQILNVVDALEAGQACWTFDTFGQQD